MYLCIFMGLSVIINVYPLLFPILHKMIKMCRAKVRCTAHSSAYIHNRAGLKSENPGLMSHNPGMECSLMMQDWSVV